MTRRGLTFLVAAILVVVLGVLAAVLPVPYVVLVPGPVTDTLGDVSAGHPVVSVSGAQTYASSGHLFLTTVGVVPGNCSDHPTLLQAIRAWFDQNRAVEPEQVICPPGESSGAVAKQNEQDMTQSQRDAVTAALLNLGFKPTHEKVTVSDVDPGTPAASLLQAGDAILAVNGQKVGSVDQLRSLVSAHPIGTALDLRIQREGKQQDVIVKTVAANDGTHRAIIGITPDISATFSKPSVHIGIDPSQVGGPSAGLAFTLGIIDKLTPGSLTGGRTVAATGTITGLGVVGPIGGIQQKIAGAKESGATVFLAPAADCSDAKAVAPSSMTLVRVDTLQTALDALRAITSGSSSFPHC